MDRADSRDGPASGVARADQAMSSVAIEYDRLYLAPGLQFGARSQELSLTLGAFAVSEVEMTLSRRGGEWWARGIRLTVVGERWSPVPVHGVVFVSFGGWSWGSLG
jgi:hypothetical protein